MTALPPRTIDPVSGPASDAPRRPGRPPSIRRADVIDAAVTVAMREGLDRFTMNQLATELGVAQMTAYYHVGSRHELVELVIQRLLEQVEIPPPDAGTWEQRLKALQSSVRENLSCIHGVPSGVTITGSPASDRVVRAVFEILRDAGFDDDTAALAYGSLFTYMVGQLDLDLATRRAAESSDDHRFAELVDRQDRPSPDDLFDFGFEALLSGLKALL